jgi:hypothetical protein
MLLVSALWSCASDPLPKLPEGSVRIGFSSRGEGEIEPCG